MIEQLSSDVKINTDNKSYTEFFAPDCLNTDNIGKNIRFLMENRSDIESIFKNISDPTKMIRFLQGNQLLSESLIHMLNGNNQLSQKYLQQAVQANPEDQEFPFLIRLYY